MSLGCAVLSQRERPADLTTLAQSYSMTSTPMARRLLINELAVHETVQAESQEKELKSP
jgi:hypothetical protein